jgi:hypothetical protein
MSTETKPRIPGWFVALAVLLTAGCTVWAIFQNSGGTWPDQSRSLPMRVTELFSPTVAATDPKNFQTVAARGQVPVIRTGAVPKHSERGACALCHVVVDALGKRIPAIQVMARVPHDYRGGLCINCHQVRAASGPRGGGAFGTFAAGQAAPGLVAGAAPPAVAVPQARPAPTGLPTEGSWLGMEVVPITPLTATQYGIPNDLRGLVVAEAEGQSTTAGVAAGDVIVAINSIPIGDMRTFLQATQNGQLRSGAVDIMRGGKFMKVSLGQAPGLVADTRLRADEPNARWSGTRPQARAGAPRPAAIGPAPGPGQMQPRPGVDFGRGEVRGPAVGLKGGAPATGTCLNGIQR